MKILSIFALSIINKNNQMASVIKKNSEVIILTTIVLTFIGLVIYNLYAHGIYRC